MGKKLRQITDNIHGTIYLSEFESNLISTPFFYRLHDVYQSSTVYLTFPSNRTKRYEHSIGTMEVASEIFFAAMTNAKGEDRKAFLEKLYEYAYEIIGKLDTAEIHGVEYLKAKGLSQALSSEYLKKEKIEIEECIFNSIKNESILDSALEHYAICFFDTLADENFESEKVGKQIARYLYIYQAVLEAIRIAALFHDVGHPPYSHIIEEVLQEIYASCQKDELSNSQMFVEKKRKKLKQCLEIFMCESGNKKKVSGLNFLLEDSNCNDKLGKTAIHEQVGLQMLKLAIEDIFPKKISEINEEKCPADERLGKALYYILIIEFTFAILLEKSMTFKSIHRIIDGVIDADRLDYIVRDSVNSGVDWGKIPYKRVIDSARLVRPLEKMEDFFAVAFPQKEQEDLEDILITRYKIFSRINYHHRSVKTATLLQNAVKELAFDYLKSEEGDEISKEISGLWTALGATLGEKALQVGQWNDSWLITVLYDALIKLSDDNYFNEFVNKKNKHKYVLERTRGLLEEVLLNHKHYYSLFKRKGDLVNLANFVFEKAKLKTAVKKTKKKELDKYCDSSRTVEQHSEAEESIIRISLLDKFLREGDFDLFEVIFPSSKPVVSMIRDVLSIEEKRGKISGFYILENKGRNKTGLPKSEDVTKKIYLYDSTSKVQEYNGYNELEAQLNSLRTSCLSFHIYIKYKAADICPQDILEKIAGKLGKELKDVYKELFPSSKKNNNTI